MEILEQHRTADVTTKRLIIDVGTGVEREKVLEPSANEKIHRLTRFSQIKYRLFDSSNNLRKSA